MIPLTAYAAAIVLYFAIGVAAWRVAERHNFDGDNWRLIYRWPGAVFVAGVVLTLVLPVIYDTLGENQ